MSDHQPISGITVALTDIPDLANRSKTTFVGVVVLMVHPDTAFYRLSLESATRLKQSITQQLYGIKRQQDRLYSINPTDWLLVLPGLRSSATLTMAMIRVQQLLDARLLYIDGMTLKLSVSCGAAQHPENGEDALYLVQSAQIAALHAKRNGDGIALYDSDMEEVDDQLKRFEHELKSAFSGESTLELFLQPQIDAKMRRCVGAEALLRWHRNHEQWVPPLEILAAIGRLGLRQRFNRWLFQTAAQTCHRLRNEGTDLLVSINLTAHDLLDPEMPELLAQSFGVLQLPLSLIRVEITESSVIENTQDVKDAFQRLINLGTSLSIDDFGTGFSGMANLKSLPFKEVKIDQSFIRNITTSLRDQEITASIIDLSHRLGLQVLAEGVENEDAASYLEMMGCDFFQGYLFSPAMALEEFIVWHKEYEEAQQLSALR
jgi:EAL domain-containing protein (putative c-di-GMP-specific phosphodiesterase class I)